MIPCERLTKTELKNLCRMKNIRGFSTPPKAELVPKCCKNRGDLSKPNPTKTAFLNQVAKDLKDFHPDGQTGEIEIDDWYVTSEFFKLGEWVPPSDMPPDAVGFDRWDYGEEEKYEKMFREWASQYKWSRLADLRVSPSEGSWVYFEVQIRNR